MSMSAIDAVLNLCNILVESNVQLCKQIQKGGLDEENLYNHFKNTAKTIKKYSKLIESHSNFSTEPHGSLSTKPRCKEEARDQYKDEEYDKLVSRIEKIKQDRQNEVKNDKKWSDINVENDELIERLNRLKPVELAEEPESDIYEIKIKRRKKNVKKMNIMRNEKDKIN